MIKGTQWTTVRVWHDDDEPSDYKVKVAYEYEYITNHDPFYQQIQSHIEVIEWPEGVTDNLRAMINHRLNDVLAELLEDDDPDESERDFDDYYERTND